jgi:hypothetical protein
MPATGDHAVEFEFLFLLSDLFIELLSGGRPTARSYEILARILIFGSLSNKLRELARKMILSVRTPSTSSVYDGF